MKTAVGVSCPNVGHFLQFKFMCDINQLSHYIWPTPDTILKSPRCWLLETEKKIQVSYSEKKFHIY